MSVLNNLISQPYFIPIFAFNGLKILLFFIDFFYRASVFRNFLTFLLPIVKVALFLTCLLKIDFPHSHEYGSHFLLGELILVGLALLGSLIIAKKTDKIYLVFLALVVAEDLFIAKSIGGLSVWTKLYHSGHQHLLTLTQK